MLPTLAYYSVAILVLSVLGGLLPAWLRLTHRWTECAVSTVAGVMLGVALLHLLPHALASAGVGSDPNSFLPTLQWTLGGFLAMFFVERFFCFHHHSVADGPAAHGCSGPEPTRDIRWTGAALGLTLHSLMAGVALAAAVLHGSPGAGLAGDAGDGFRLAGFGTFVAIALHKPFDSMTIAMLMTRGGWSQPMQAAVNALFALAVPAGVALAWAGGLSAHDSNSASVSAALAFSAGVFLCIAMSDLLPELQFHDHDRLKLSAALLLGLALAWAACQLETHTHQTPPADGAVEEREGEIEFPEEEPTVAMQTLKRSWR